MSNKKRQRNNKNKQNRNNKRPAQDNFKPKDNVVISEIEYTDGITVKDLSEKINKSPAEVIKALIYDGNNGYDQHFFR